MAPISSHVQWSRRGYDAAALEHVYTGDQARVASRSCRPSRTTIAEPARNACARLLRQRRARPLHGQGVLQAAGSRRSLFLAETSSEDREAALRDLRDGKVNVVFCVDLFNEGVDVPEIDTVLFLRPTESALVFLQQLGRGLRRSEQQILPHRSGLHWRCEPAVSLRSALPRAPRRPSTPTRSVRSRKASRGCLPGCAIQLDRVASRHRPRQRQGKPRCQLRRPGRRSSGLSRMRGASRARDAAAITLR